MSELDESKAGYPEEGPPGADPSGGDRSEDTPAREHAEDAPENEDGTATGNPKAAG